MSYTSPDADRTWTQYTERTAAKDWPCSFARVVGDCDGTIHPGDTYIDEAVVPWAPIYDEVGEDDYGYPTIGQVDVVGHWTHTRYHKACEAKATERALDIEMFGSLQEMRAEEERQAAEFADWKKAEEEDGPRQRRERQQFHSRKARRQREIATHAGATILDDHR